MKTAIVVTLLLSSLCLAQSGSITSGSVSSMWGGKPDDGWCWEKTSLSSMVSCKDIAHHFLLAYGTTEKCYECPTRYLMNCASGDDCNVPPKTVMHYRWFDTEDAVFVWLKDNQPPVVYGIIIPAKEIPVSVDARWQDVPQPAKSEIKRTYQIGKAK